MTQYATLFTGYDNFSLYYICSKNENYDIYDITRIENMFKIKYELINLDKLFGRCTSENRLNSN